MRKYTLALIACLLCLQQAAFSQLAGQPSYDAAKPFSPDQLQHDFAILAAAIPNAHPAVHKFTTPENWQALTSETKNKLDKAFTEEEFHVLIRQYLMHLRCGHTVALPSEAWYAYQKQEPKVMPVKVFVLQDKVYVKEALVADSVLIPGTEITAINNMAAADILAQMRAIQPRDGHSDGFVNASVESNFQTYHLFLFGKQEDYTIGYKNQLNEQASLVIKGGKGRKDTPEVGAEPAPFLKEIKTANARFYIPQQNAKVGVLDIDGFLPSDYKKFYKTVFRQMKADKVEHLIIDVRDNSGGYFPNANFLLRHLLTDKFAFTINRPKGKIKSDPNLKMDYFSRVTNRVFTLLPDKDKADPNLNYALPYKPRKKNHYNGKVYVLINGSTFSISSYTASMLKHKANAVVIGTETGGGEANSNGILFYRLTLPETGIRVIIPYYELETIRGTLSAGRGIMPHVPVSYSKEEIQESRNKELEEAFLYINQSR